MVASGRLESGPSVLYVIQFPYRLLAQIQWMGVLCVALALAPPLRTISPANQLPVIVGAVFCILTSSTYLDVGTKKMNVSEIVREPDIGYGGDMYVRKMNAPGVTLPRMEANLFSVRSVVPCRQKLGIVRSGYGGRRRGANSRSLLSTISGRASKRSGACVRKAARSGSQGGGTRLVALELRPGRSVIRVEFVGSRLGNWISLITLCH